MTDSRKPVDQIRGELQGLARPVADELRRTRIRNEALRWEGLALLLLAVPVLYVSFAAMCALLGFDVRLPWAVILPLSLVLPSWRLRLRWQNAAQQQVADEAALVAIDRELRLADRLSAANEFAAGEQPTGMELAAIHDAEQRLAAARAARPTEAAPEGSSPLPFGWAALAAFVLLKMVHWLPIHSNATEVVESGDPAPAVASSGEQRDETSEQPREPEPQPPKPQQRTPRASETEAGSSAAKDDESPANEKRRGKNPLGAGRSAQARTAQGGGSERGQPSNQAQSTKGDQGKKPKEKKKTDEKRDERERPEEARQPPEQSGATQGRGSGKGSSKSPTASPWSAKDEVVTDDEQDPEEDEEVDDENDESKARGGVQPNLRQRKPPVNRDLQISMGNGPPQDDANGRGGPGGPKKQRGVAQLVLGVTFPDHVSAKPNPGISKITQERIEPQAQQGDRVDGESRGRRAAPMGHLSRRVLRPWMQDLVRSFYLSLRKEGGSQ